MRKQYLLGFASLLMLAACNPPAADTNVNIDMDDDNAMTSSQTMSMAASSGPFLDDENNSASMDEEDDGVEIDLDTSATADVTKSASSAPAVQQGQTRVITVNITNWAFSPTMITAKKGEKVQLKLVGGEGIHGFGVPGLGINVRVEGGKIVTIDLPTGTAGTFDVMCTIPCGSGHKSMKATIVIS
jgi:cytochrome c oxidase subunit II